MSRGRGSRGERRDGSSRGDQRRREQRLAASSREPSIVFVVVEGFTDEQTLFNPLEHYFKQAYPDPGLQVVFCRMKENKKDNTGRKNGDITSRAGVTKGNIVDKLYQWALRPNMPTGFTIRDAIRIVQIADLDGAYIPDERVSQSPVACDKPTYHEDCIIAPDEGRLRQRNARKKENLNFLAGQDTVCYDGRDIDYSIYYFSCDLDHFVHGNANYSRAHKKQGINIFRGVEGLARFNQMVLNDSAALINRGYRASWEFARRENHSLEKGTNLGILIEELAEIAEQT